MKITKTANNKNKIIISKKEWESLGRKAGWLNKNSEIIDNTAFDYEFLDELDKEKEQRYKEFRIQKGLDPDSRFNKLSVVELLRKRLYRAIEKQVSEFEDTSYENDPIWQELNSIRERLNVIDKDIASKGIIDSHISTRIRSLNDELDDTIKRGRNARHGI